MSDVTPESAEQLSATPTLVQKLSAEALGTFFLVLVGCGVVVSSGLQSYLSQLAYCEDNDYCDGISAADYATGSGFTLGLGFALALVAVTFALYRVSGAHLNPAVSVASAIAGRLSWAEAALYSAAQVAGGILAGAVLVLFLQGFEGFDAFAFPIAANGFGDDGTGLALWSALLIEIVLTALFALIYLASTDRRGSMTMLAPLAIGFGFGALYFALGSADGGGLNPARSLGANLFSGGDAVKQVWVFVIAPLVGGALGGALHGVLFGKDRDDVPGSGIALSSGSSAPGYGTHQGPYAGQWGQTPGAPAGPQQPYQQAYEEQPGQGASQPAPQAEQPIIQDGWQWDPQAQQWIPAPQPPPDGGSTQIRPGG